MPPPPPALISPPAAAHLISSVNPPILIDARPPSLHAIEHLRGAISPPPLVTLSNIRSHRILIYDSGTTSLAHTFSRATQQILRLHTAVPNHVSIFLIEGGLPAIRYHAPHLIETPPLSSIPSLISARLARYPWAMRALRATHVEAASPAPILSNLFLGSFAHSTDPDFLSQAGITHILAVGDDFPTSFTSPFSQSQITRLHLPVSDLPSAPIAALFPAAIDFLEPARLNNSPTLVHCLAGASRSVAIVLAYLVWLRCPFEKALSHVKSLRPAADPNPGFLSQLQDWVQYLNSDSPSLTSYPRPAIPQHLSNFPQAINLPPSPCTPPGTPYLPSSPVTPCTLTTVQAIETRCQFRECKPRTTSATPPLFLSPPASDIDSHLSFED